MTVVDLEWNIISCETPNAKPHRTQQQSAQKLVGHPSYQSLRDWGSFSTNILDLYRIHLDEMNSIDFKEPHIDYTSPRSPCQYFYQ